MIRFLVLILLCMSELAIAQQDLGLGRVAQNLMEPVSVLSDLVTTACIIIGGSFIFAAMIKYFEYRRSPMMVPISTVIFLLIAGLLLLLLPLLSYIAPNLKYS